MFSWSRGHPSQKSPTTHPAVTSAQRDTVASRTCLDVLCYFKAQLTKAQLTDNECGMVSDICTTGYFHFARENPVSDTILDDGLEIRP